MLALLSLTSLAPAAPSASEQPVEHTVIAASGYGGRIGSANLRYVPAIGLGRARRVRLGPQVRALGLFGTATRLATVNTDNVGDGDPAENALLVDRFAVGSLNVGLCVDVQLGDRWHIGLNLDLVGMPVGGGDATFDEDGTQTEVRTASPSPSLAFTRGQVTSDNLVLGYSAVPDRWTVFVAWNQSGMELLTDAAPSPTAPERRYERTVMMAKVGVAVVLPGKS